MRQFFEKKLQYTINHYLSLDPESNKRLWALNEKAILIRLLPQPVEIQLVFSEGRVLVSTSNFLISHTIITGTPISLIHLAIAKNRQAFFRNSISIEGDIECAQLIINLFDELEIDWEELLSLGIGDIAAHQVNNIINLFKKNVFYFNRSMKKNLNEYLHEEINLFPPREALEDFFQEIDKLRMDTDRLAVRVENLIKELGEQ